MGVVQRLQKPRNMEIFMVRVFVLVALMVALVRCHPNPQLDFQPRRGRTPNAKGDQRARQARSESGFETNSVEGSYSFVSPEGRSYAVTYTADENGYFPRGSGIHPALMMALRHLR